MKILQEMAVATLLFLYLSRATEENHENSLSLAVNQQMLRPYYLHYCHTDLLSFWLK